MLTYGFERISFQNNSKLAKRIFTCVNDTMIKLEDKYNEVKTFTIGTVHPYTEITDKFKKELETIVFEETGVNNQVFVDPSLTYFNGAMLTLFDPIIEKDDLNSHIYITDAMQGTHNDIEHNKSNYNSYKQTLEIISNNLDLNTSRLKSNVSKIRSKLFLYLSVLMSKCLYPVHITPEEVTAMILHEIGHTMTYIELCTAMYHRCDIISNSVKLLQLEKDDEILNKYGTDLIEIIKNNKDLTTIEKENLIKLITDDNKNKAYNLGIATIITAISDKKLISDKNFQNAKVSDIVLTKLNFAYIERIADEFCVRHGYGHHLISGLEKSRKYQLGDFDTKYVPYVRTVSTLTLLMKYFFGPITNGFISGYDDDILRCEEVYFNTLVRFKDSNLPKDVSLDFINSIKSLKNTINEIKERDIHKFRNLIFSTILRISNSGSLSDMLASANMIRDYEILQKMTNNLIRNPFYYQSERLKHF